MLDKLYIPSISTKLCTTTAKDTTTTTATIVRGGNDNAGGPFGSEENEKQPKKKKEYFSTQSYLLESFVVDKASSIFGYVQLPLGQSLSEFPMKRVEGVVCQPDLYVHPLSLLPPSPLTSNNKGKERSFSYMLLFHRCR